jgi:type II secretory pathway component PulM
MKAWLENLDPRERMMVVAGGALFVLFLLYIMVW